MATVGSAIVRDRLRLYGNNSLCDRMRSAICDRLRSYGHQPLENYFSTSRACRLPPNWYSLFTVFINTDKTLIKSSSSLMKRRRNYLNQYCAIAIVLYTYDLFSDYSDFAFRRFAQKRSKRE